MTNTPLEQAVDRAERALLRIERAIDRSAMSDGKDQALRATVADALAELDVIIREAGAQHG